MRARNLERRRRVTLLLETPLDLLTTLRGYPLLADPSVLRSTVVVAMGIVLAATCGLRAFLPLFGLSIVAWAGRLQVSEGFAWMASGWAVLCFGTAVLAEILADKFPAVDHAMDAIGLVARPLAGTLVLASVMGTRDPLLACVVGLIAGGTAAGGVQLVKAKVRILSTTFTAGLANAVVSFVEDVLAITCVVLTLIFPILAFIGLAFAGVGAAIWFRRRQGRRATA